MAGSRSEVYWVLTAVTVTETPVLDQGSVCHLRTLVLGVDNDRIRPTPSSRAIGYAPIRYTIWV